MQRSHASTQKSVQTWIRNVCQELDWCRDQKCNKHTSLAIFYPAFCSQKKYLKNLHFMFQTLKKEEVKSTISQKSGKHVCVIGSAVVVYCVQIWSLAFCGSLHSAVLLYKVFRQEENFQPSVQPFRTGKTEIIHPVLN